MKNASNWMGGLVVVLLTALVQMAWTQNNFWEATQGPAGASVAHVLVSSGGDIFLSVEGRGLFRSVDGGTSYQQLQQGLPAAPILSLAQNNNGDLFVGFTNYGIYKSSDNGDTWTQVYNDLLWRDIFCLYIDPQNGDIFAGTAFGTDGAVIRSTDGGSTWQRFEAGLEETYRIQSIVVQPSTGFVFAGSQQKGVFRSTDRGATWSPFNPNLNYQNILALAATSTGDVFAGADSTILKHGVFRLSAGGNSWSLVLSTSRTVSSIFASDTDILVGTEGEWIFQSSDGGTTWTQRFNGLRSALVLDVFVSANQEIFAATHCAGLFNSLDQGNSWAPLNGDLRYTHIRSLAANPVSGAIFAGTHCGGVFRSTDGGMNWSWVGLPHENVNALLATDQGTVFAGTGTPSPLGSNGDIYRSSDDGNSWTPVTPHNDGYLSLAQAPDGTIYAGTGFFSLCGFSICDYGDIFHSNDPGGFSWTRVANRLDDHVFGLAVNPTGRVFVATREGVYRSFSTFWHKILNGDARSVLAVGDTVFVGTSDGIFRSVDEGEFWDQVLSLPNNYTWSLLADPQGNVYAATEKSGILQSTDGGINWTSINSGLSNLDVRSLAFDPQTGRIFAGTEGDGVFRSLNLVTGIKPLAEASPAITFELLPNYPNPFNPSTIIAFRVGNTQTGGMARVTLAVYDPLGR
ncbi:MAG: hypothetical protein D6715_02895, partial [Calditrichaeota bacterium]